ILTRGYGRADSSVTGLVTALDAARFGDEPVLIKRSAPGADVIVGSKRYRNAIQYLSSHSCDVFLLDDGFQHLQIARDLDVVIDAPSAFFREGRGALAHADVVVPRQLRLTVPDELRGRPVFAFSGLADNEQFFASLREAGLDLVGTRGFGDHHRYTSADLEQLRREAGVAPLVTTEKDAVKLPDGGVLAIGADFVFPEEALSRIMAAVQQKDGKRKKKRRKKGRVLQIVEYGAYRVIAALVGRMSEESAYRWGTRFGRAMGKILRRRDRLAMRNLTSVFPETGAKELRETLDRCWEHFGREGLLYVRMQNLTLEEVLERCPISGQDILRDAVARGKGTMLITAHWGSWEVAGLALMAAVPNLTTVARTLDNEYLERALQERRRRTGGETVDRRKAARVLVRALAQNRVIGVLPDQAVQPREGILVPFLGRPAWTTPAPAKMAARAGSTIVFGFCIPDGFRHRFDIDEVIVVDDLPESERDAVALTTRINDVISRRIKARPDLWLWMHDRWKGTGEGEAMDGQ
ncbi:MAG: tetraacyldisaccharide 4'-kinase, partial [Thermoanaerobaculia bacterium]